MKTFQIFKTVSLEYFVNAEDFDSAIKKIIDEQLLEESEELIEWSCADEHDGKEWQTESTSIITQEEMT
jgi:hypothetical protein